MDTSDSCLRPRLTRRENEDRSFRLSQSTSPVLLFSRCKLVYKQYHTLNYLLPTYAKVSRYCSHARLGRLGLRRCQQNMFAVGGLGAEGPGLEEGAAGIIQIRNLHLRRRVLHATTREITSMQTPSPIDEFSRTSLRGRFDLIFNPMLTTTTTSFARSTGQGPPRTPIIARCHLHISA
jgi:hypothetical protein